MSDRNYLISVWKDTQQKCLTDHYGHFVAGYSLLMRNMNMIEPKNIIKKFEKTHVKVINDDAFTVARMYIDGINKVVTLNHANANHLFGGVERGAKAQEEDLARMSNYFLFYTNKFLPIKPTRCVYTTNICIVKDKNYNDLPKQYYTDMMAFAALNKPKLTHTGLYADHADFVMMKQSIENMFRVSYGQGKDTLILGAWGCGAFGNPPEAVAKIFNEYVEKYDKCFKNIVFAVLSNNDNNFDVFNSVIKSKN